MQASHLNKIIFSCFLYLGIWQNANCQIDTKQISKADSLFKTNQLLEAEKIYLQFYNPRYKEIENIKFKSFYFFNFNYFFHPSANSKLSFTSNYVKEAQPKNRNLLDIFWQHLLVFNNWEQKPKTR